MVNGRKVHIFFHCKRRDHGFAPPVFADKGDALFYGINRSGLFHLFRTDLNGSAGYAPDAVDTFQKFRPSAAAKTEHAGDASGVDGDTGVFYHVLSGIMCLLSASPFPLISRTSSFWLVEAVSQVLTSSPFLSTVTRSVSAMISSSLWVT